MSKWPEVRERLLERIRTEYLPRYPSKQAATLPALHMVQDEIRCVPLQAIRDIADLLDLSPAEVHDTMSFYGFFRGEQDALGRTRLWICRSLACALRGGEELLADVCQKLHVSPGATTDDGKITVEFVECIGACEGAPCVLLNDEARFDVTPEKVDALLAELRQQLMGIAMSIYCTLWQIKLPHRYHFDDEWVKVAGQAVPAHIGHPKCYPERDPYADFLPPVVEYYDDERESPFHRAVVIVCEGRDQKDGQRYVDPMIVMTGEEYTRLTFGELYNRICKAMNWDEDIVGMRRLPNGNMELIRRQEWMRRKGDRS